MTYARVEPESRTIEVQTLITAPIEAVWKALTDATELVRWFPLQARIVPGVGGSVWLSWGDPIVSESAIEAWEPNRHLRVVERRPLGVLLQPEGTKLDPRILDYWIGTLGTQTLLRVSHSGFGSGSYWDELYAAVERGWEFQVRSLRHYLQRHAGTDRRIASVRRSLSLPVESVWDRFIECVGLFGINSSGRLREGEYYSIRAATGDRLEGRVLIYDPPKQLAVTLTNWNDSLFRVYLVENISGAVEANLWLGAYGILPAQVEAFGSRWKQLLEQILG